MAFLGPFRPWIVAVAIAGVMCLHGSVDVGGQTQPAAIEANVKAVFLFNFAKYVTWPVVAIGEPSPAGVRICVTVDDAIYNLLNPAVQGEVVDGKPLIPVSLDDLDEAKRCQILYVGDSRSADAKAWLAAVRGAQVLTVADGVLNDETIIAFVRDNNRIRFDINRASANRRNLNVSSKLLRLARQVREQ